jgi:hypothetical protein
MARMRILLASVLVMNAACLSSTSETQPSSPSTRPLVIHNGRIFGNADADAILVEGTTIKQVGRATDMPAEAERLENPNAISPYVGSRAGAAVRGYEGQLR